jgi:hypothetical protein
MVDSACMRHLDLYDRRYSFSTLFKTDRNSGAKI